VNKLTNKELEIFESTFTRIQKNIENGIKKLNTSPPIRVAKVWKRDQGGGGKSISITGDTIEKAAVNYSSISGKKLPDSSIASKIKSTSNKFHAIGVSSIAHPMNPFCPTSHMNVRIFLELGKKNNIENWWIGGGFDLTPFFPTKEESLTWHLKAKSCLDNFDNKFYKKFAKNCDDYFYLPHRKEKRGIGGVFFDQLQHKNISKSLVLLEEVAKCYIETYVELVNINKKHKFTAEDREFQLYRRGRYVEFNLLFDRGTKFGIESNGRTDSILASMPPAVNWPFRLSANIIKKEKKLLKFIDKKCNDHF
jgi:coproporphyrinogen III oxidase